MRTVDLWFDHGLCHGACLGRLATIFESFSLLGAALVLPSVMSSDGIFRKTGWQSALVGMITGTIVMLAWKYSPWGAYI